MLSKRAHLTEQLDNLDFQGEELENTLGGLSKINRWFGNTNQTLKIIQQEILENNIKTIVDLGYGGGDNLRAISKWCKVNNKEIELIGIDGNLHTLNYAKSQGGNFIEYIQADILSPNFEVQTCDLLISSHFVYHFEDQKLINFLKKARLKVKRSIIFSELERNRIAYFLFIFIGTVFGKTVKKDGLTAIKRAFLKQELEFIFLASGFKKTQIKRTIWFRLLVKADTI